MRENIQKGCKESLAAASCGIILEKILSEEK